MTIDFYDVTTDISIANVATDIGKKKRVTILVYKHRKMVQLENHHQRNKNTLLGMSNSPFVEEFFIIYFRATLK